jgi:hypothetical protein
MATRGHATRHILVQVARGVGQKNLHSALIMISSKSFPSTVLITYRNGWAKCQEKQMVSATRALFHTLVFFDKGRSLIERWPRITISPVPRCRAISGVEVSAKCRRSQRGQVPKTGNYSLAKTLPSPLDIRMERYWRLWVQIVRAKRRAKRSW